MRAQNLVVMDQRVTWPKIAFRPRTVTVGERTAIRLIPHLGEFDQAALFSKRFTYEKEVFAWLEQNAPTRYDTVIEIGANVGVFSVFLNALIEAFPNGRLKRVISFEPALEPFSRLLDNLRANQARHVVPYRAAIADETGIQKFFEPEDHLTNGSLIKEFAGIFSDNVRENVVIALGPRELSHFFRSGSKVLVKIDVEGYEPQLMRALGDIIAEHRPDFLIEVLEGTPEPVDAIEALNSYGRYLITPGGLERRDRLETNASYRDWLLKASEASP